MGVEAYSEYIKACCCGLKYLWKLGNPRIKFKKALDSCSCSEEIIIVHHHN